MKTEYKIELFEGHVLINVDEKKYLIDTGSQITLSKESNIKLADKIYSDVMSNFLGLNIDEIEKLLGRQIDGLIGADILSDFIVTFDLINMILVLSDQINYEGRNSFELGFVMGIPIINCFINKKSVKLIIDTGAHLSYLNPELTNNEQPVGKKRDFHPMIGRFETDIYKLTTTINSINIDVTYGNLPEMLQTLVSLTGASGIVGFDIFKDRSITIDYLNEKICL